MLGGGARIVVRKKRILLPAEYRLEWSNGKGEQKSSISGI
jgi:hypothetical protein